MATLLFVLGRRTRQPAFYAWSAAFFLIVADDSLMIHERMGLVLAESFGMQPFMGLRAKDFGELLTWGLIWAPMLLVLFVSHRRSDDSARRRSRLLAYVLLALAFFAAVLDMIHMVVQELVSSGLGDHVFGVAEDGGELFVLSCALLLVAGWFMSDTPDGHAALDGRRRQRSAEPAAPPEASTSPVTAGDDAPARASSGSGVLLRRHRRG